MRLKLISKRFSEFIHWLRTDGDRLVDAARLLGGPDWATRVRFVVETARAGHDAAARRRELFALRKLLHLEYTADLGSVEARLFADIDPVDPRADDAHLCVDVLDWGVRALEALRLFGVVNLREAA